MLQHSDCIPSQIVMAEHAAFGVASRATRVNQTATLTRFLLLHLCHDNFSVDGGLAKL